MLKSAEDLTNSFAAIVRLPGVKIAALALAAWIVLLLPPEYALIPAPAFKAFRTTWGGLILLLAIALSALALFSAVAGSIASVRSWLARRRAKPSLVVQADETGSWWHLTEQEDGSYTTQISVRLHIRNRRPSPVKVIGTRLVRPRPRGSVTADLFLPMQGSPYHDPNNPILPDQPVWASAHFMAKGQLAFQGDALRVAIELRDDRGEKYRSSRIKVMSQDQKEAPSIARRVMRLWRDEQGPKRLQLDGLDWDWSDQDPTASLKEPLELILAEEQRHYAAKGRREGKLGSLSTGLQSAPNLGWTKVGDVPELLWPKGQGEPVKSPTVDRILRLHEHADVAIRRAVEERLMTYLHRASPFNNVAYAIFLALHRLGRTRDALLKANNDLRGAPAFAHSNLLGCLAAVVSREHESLSLAQIDELRTCFPENEDTEFQLREKLTLARVLKQGD